MAVWPFASFVKAKKTIAKHSIKTVYTSSGPFSSLVLGYLLKKFSGVKWIADMRDPFTDAYAWNFPSRLHWIFARIFEKFLLSRTDHLIVNTPEVKKLYIRRGIHLSDQISVITNGY
jgi:hypothetical protein